jgi:hypothetical protein
VIAARRARHFAIWLILAVALPLLVFLAVRARPAPPTQPELPPTVETFPDDTREAKRP